eukprot:g2236.t1
MSAPACANPGVDARKLNAKGIIAGSIRKGDADAVESMLEANPELLNAYVGGSSTPVCFACAFNQAAIVEVCIALGADLNKRNGAGQTPLLVAAGRGHIACVEALLRTELSVDIHALSRNGQTAIDVAESRRGHEDACAIAITCRSPQTTGVYNFLDDFRSDAPGGGGDEWVSLPQHFRMNGFQTIGAGKVFHPGKPPLNDAKFSWDNYVYFNGDDAGCNLNETIYPDVCPSSSPAEAFYDDRVVESIIKEIQRQGKIKGDGRKHFFFAAGLRRPHRPWHVPKDYYQLYDAHDLPLPRRTAPPKGAPLLARIRNAWPPENFFNVSSRVARLARFGYYASVSSTDAMIGRLLQSIEDEGFANTTVVALVSDHGFHLGEQGEYCKRTNFELATRIPLMIRAPNYPQSMGRSTDQFFSLLDLYKTLNALSHAAEKVENGVEGKDLSSLFLFPRERKDPESYAFSQMARCPVHDQPLNSACNNVPREQIPFMGFSVRTKLWRYTVWLPFDGRKNRADWSNSTSKVDELYSHAGDDGSNFNLFETVNVAEEHMDDIVPSLFALLRERFDY